MQRQRSIPELDTIFSLEAIATEYEQRFGAAPFNLSHWDPSEHAERILGQYLQFPLAPQLMSYLYSDELSLERPVLERLGLPTEDVDCQIVPNGTVAILFAIARLKALGIRKLVVLCPAYFPVFYACDLLEVPYVRLYLSRRAGSWEMPLDELRGIIQEPSTALWVTNPIYCTGRYLGLHEIALVNELLAARIPVVVDECLALAGREIGRGLKWDPNLFCLYSPHKAVCVNAVKFAVVSFHSSHTRFFIDWSNVIIGGLAASNYAAVQHFLSPNFLTFQSALLEYIAAQRVAVEGLVGRYTGVFDIDSASEGYFMTCYAPRVPSMAGNDAFVKELAFQTGALVIPGWRNHFPDCVGFCFRINLARGCPQFMGALGRTLSHLSQLRAR